MAGAVDYRMAPAVMARVVGAYLVALALLVGAVTVGVTAANWSGDVIVVVVGLGLVALFGTAAWLRGRGYVVRLTPQGYHVRRLVRGVGVRRGDWSEVAEAVATHREGLAVVVLRRHDGRETTIPVAALDADREAFADDVIAHLRRAAAQRPERG